MPKIKPSDLTYPDVKFIVYAGRRSPVDTYADTATKLLRMGLLKDTGTGFSFSTGARALAKKWLKRKLSEIARRANRPPRPLYVKEKPRRSP